MNCKNCGHAKGVHARRGECHFGVDCKCKKFVQHAVATDDVGESAESESAEAGAAGPTNLQEQIDELKGQIGDLEALVKSLVEKPPKKAKKAKAPKLEAKPQS